MKTQRGFVSVAVLIAIVLALIVVGGGAYFVMQSNQSPQTISENNLDTLPTTQTPVQKTPQQNVSASAAIDQNSLTTTSANPTISGSASGSSGVYVYLFSATYSGGRDYLSVSGAAQGDTVHASPSPSVVSSGRWSATFNDGRISLGAGSYTVVVYDSISHALLTTGSLVVKTTTSSGKPAANEVSFVTPAGYIIESEPSYQDAAWHEASGIDKRISIVKKEYANYSGPGIGGSASIIIDFNRNPKNLTVQQWLQEKVGCSAQESTTYSFKDQTGVRCVPSAGQHMYDGIAVQDKNWIVYILNSYDTDSEVQIFNQLLASITFAK